MLETFVADAFQLMLESKATWNSLTSNALFEPLRALSGNWPRNMQYEFFEPLKSDHIGFVA